MARPWSYDADSAGPPMGAPSPKYALDPWEEEDPFYQQVPRETPPPMGSADPQLPDIQIPGADGSVPNAKGRTSSIYSQPPDPYGDVISKRDAHLKRLPKRTDQGIKLSTGEQVGGAVQNAIAGWVNSGRRGHVDPVDMNKVSDRRYSDAMDAWGREGHTIDQDLALAQARDARNRQAQADQRAAEMHGSIMEERAARARHYDEMDDKKTPSDVVLGKQGVWDPVNKRIYPGTAQEPAAPTSKDRTAQGILLDPTSTPEQKAAAQRILDGQNKSRAATGAASSAADRRQQKSQDYQTGRDNTKRLRELETVEYGDPLKGTKGLYEQKAAAQREMQSANDDGQAATKGSNNVAWPAGAKDSLAENRAKMQEINTRLRMVYKEKRDMGAITEEQYQSMVQGLEDVAPPKPSTPPTPPQPAAAGAPQQPAKPRPPLTGFDHK